MNCSLWSGKSDDLNPIIAEKLLSSAFMDSMASRRVQSEDGSGVVELGFESSKFPTQNSPSSKIEFGEQSIAHEVIMLPGPVCNIIEIPITESARFNWRRRGCRRVGFGLVSMNRR